MDRQRAEHKGGWTKRTGRPALTIIRPEGTVAYIGGSDSLPAPLTREEEQALFARMADEPNTVRQTLIEHNLRLVVYIARKFENTGVGIEDLISIGTIGLIKGITSFDPEKGARLATYAARCIENEILMYFRSQKKLQGEVSLSDSIESDKEGNALQLMDVVGVDDTMLDDIHARDSALLLHQLIQQRLTPREAEIIRLRYGLGGTVPLTQREIAASFNISRSYVSRIEKRALEKLREEMSGPSSKASRESSKP